MVVPRRVLSCRSLLLYGEWRHRIYEGALAQGFEACGYKVVPFNTSEYLSDTIGGRIQKKLLLGPRLSACDQAFQCSLLRLRPDVVFLRLPIFLSPREIARARAQLPKTRFISYCNDNPYEDGRRFQLWRRYHETIRFCDMNFFFRINNVLSAQYEGVPRPRLAPPYYTEELHRKLDHVTPEYSSEVVFVGHFENDGRHRFIEALLEANVKVRVYGVGWETAPARVIGRIPPIRPVYDDEYVKVLNGARIALVFLSSLNRDYWTSRCMEIPACGTLMAAMRNPVLEEIFEPGREAVYFESPAELVDIAKKLLLDTNTSDAIAQKGRLKCLSRGLNNISLARMMVKEFTGTLDTEPQVSIE